MKKIVSVGVALLLSLNIFASGGGETTAQAKEEQTKVSAEKKTEEKKAETKKSAEKKSEKTEAEEDKAEESLKKLQEGNKRFTAGRTVHPNQTAKRRKEVAAGQHPSAVIVTCSDSRVPPEILFDAGLGDIFVVRTAGNVVDDVAIGSIEYAVEHLHVPLVVVMGHEKCGAVDAAVKGGEVPGHIEKITEMIKPSVDKAKTQSGDLLDNAVHNNVEAVVNTISESKPIMKDLISKGEVKVAGAYYDLDTGEVKFHEVKIKESQESLMKLLDGNKRYASGRMINPNQNEKRRAEVAKGQHPSAVIVTCSDSRVPPEILFDAGLGDIFVVRTAGNVVDSAAMGSIEYAVEHLKTPLVMVLGHEKCGAVDAAVKGGDAQGSIAALIEAITPAVEAARKEEGDLLDNSVKKNVEMVRDKLLGTTPIITEFIAGGELEIVGAYYDLDTGKVSLIK